MSIQSTSFEVSKRIFLYRFHRDSSIRMPIISKMCASLFVVDRSRRFIHCIRRRAVSRSLCLRRKYFFFFFFLTNAQVTIGTMMLRDRGMLRLLNVKRYLNINGDKKENT